MSVIDSLKRPAVLGTLLAVSVAGNLFLGGILAGRLGARAMHPPLFARDFEATLRGVPEERRLEMREHMRRNAPLVREHHERKRALFDAIAAEMAREQPDRALLETQMAELRARSAAMQEALHKGFLDTTLALAPAERRKMLEAMQQQGDRGWRGRLDGP
ncbi:MAG: periplasmic heavy metal sensor [Pseudomonadales bacterium]|nr:periplasmic heavy metal sensor [Pseudomonadales bacterium]MBP9033500.1 periplasmic heavy metal sensor [Pseudomonadales bacterium]